MKKIAIILIFLFYLFSTKQAAASVASLDQTFNTTGKIISQFGFQAIANKILLQVDGKTIILGDIAAENNGINRDWAITRYLQNGSIDASYGNNGLIKQGLSNNNDSITAAVLQQDGRLVVGGYSGPGFTWSVGRYNSNGTLDSSFGNGGIIVSQRQGFINDILVQQDNKIVAVGYFIGTGNDEVAIVRYNTNGTLDTSFGNNGVRTFPVGASNDRGTNALLLPSGSIIIAGDFDAGGHDEIFLTKYTSSGELDSTFGLNGISKLKVGNSAGARDLIQDLEGRILITGGTLGSLGLDTYLLRYDSNGRLDTSFGVEGKLINSFVISNDFSNSMAIQQDGKILIGGGQDTATDGSEFVIRRINADGGLDDEFGTSGSFIVSMSQGHDEVRSIAVRNGKISMTGYVFNGNHLTWGTARISEQTVLEVPILKQGTSPWGGLLYDSANQWAGSKNDIARWGCAITSAAMVFQYHGVKKMPDNSNLDPGTLNSWLKSQPDGYIRNGLVNWIALSRLSLLAKSKNSYDGFDALEYSRFSGANKTQLSEDLTNKLPAILEEPGHFIVAKGEDIDNNTFLINDPFYSRDSLSDYGNTFKSLRRFVPSQTDLSYLMFVVDQDIDIKLKDASGNEIGESYIQSPLDNPIDDSENAEPLKILYMQKPENGDYTIEVSSSSISNYRLDGYLYDNTGNVKKLEMNGIVGNDNVDIYKVGQNKENINQGSIRQVVTFDSLKSDLMLFYKTGKIKNIGIYSVWTAEVEQAKLFSKFSKKGTKEILKTLKKQISREKKGIDSTSKAILLSELNLLIASL